MQGKNSESFKDEVAKAKVERPLVHMRESWQTKMGSEHLFSLIDLQAQPKMGASNETNGII